jgi:hypothetical protein
MAAARLTAARNALAFDLTTDGIAVVAVVAIEDVGHGHLVE